MPQVQLSAQQAKAIQEATKPVELVDPEGRKLGEVAAAGLTPEQFAELKHRAASKGPFYSSAEVQDFLNELHAEWKRLGSFDRKHLETLLIKKRERKAS